jgi:hypothetical protein
MGIIVLQEQRLSCDDNYNPNGVLNYYYYGNRCVWSCAGTTDISMLQSHHSSLIHADIVDKRTILASGVLRLESYFNTYICRNKHD